MIKRFRKIYSKYERHISSGALIAGFTLDNFTLTRIDLLYDNLVLFSYLSIAGLGIVVLNLHKGGVVGGPFFDRLSLWLPLAMQFAFGGLFSGFFIFYSRSASFAASWPFIIFLLTLLIGNEFFRKRYISLGFQLSIFFVALFSFMIFYIPILVGTMGAHIFLLSGLASIGIIWLVIYGLSRVISSRVKRNKKMLFWGIGSIFVLINIFYFTNIIPPIPLSLKQAGVYHSVVRQNGDYLAEREEKKWYDFFRLHDEINIIEGEPVYIFSAIFAPSKINTNILHHWQYFDEKKDEWISVNRLGFSIYGGRDGGYRGYTFKRSMIEGLWRVDIITKREQLLGRVKFNVNKVNSAPVLETDIL